ncbi:unnamed protein product [Orchesella dallaii]|uniref:Uncharacterized protein n=2 Tax=Orchesella dallaii TaxID=48710 RepID=A0ABP1QSE3_9HEXA
MSAVLKKGAPSRSYPSRQRKLGPAPFASFEDLSDELESPGHCQPGDDSSNKVSVLPEIKEDRLNERVASCQSPTMMGMSGDGEETPNAVRAHRNVTATSSTSTVTFAPSYSAPTSGPTSGLQTPSTPRIDISCASSSTPPSDESASEKELFQGGLGLAFHEEAVDDLRSSTEELDLGEEEISSEEERRRKRLEEQEMRDSEIYRRSSHPANIFSRKSSVPAAPPPPDDAQRKPSAHSLFLEGLLNRPCRHSSFGHGDYMRPGAVSSLSTHSAGSGQRSRSPSPHKLMFETSFCGAKPIPTKSMEAESPPKDKNTAAAPVTVEVYSQQSIAVVTALPPLTPTSRLSDDSMSLKSPKKPVTPGWERHPELEQVCEAEGPKDIDSVSRSKTPLSPQPSSLGFDSRRPSAGRRSVSPHNMLLETSFCGSRPIPTRSMEMESPPKELPDLGELLAECNKLAGLSSDMNAYCHKTVTTAQVHRHSSGDRSSIVSRDDDQPRTTNQKEVRSKSDASQYTIGVTESGTAEWNSVPYLHGSPESPKSSDLWQPISPRMELRSPITVSSSQSHPHASADSSVSSQTVKRTDARLPPSPPRAASLTENLENSRKCDLFTPYDNSQNVDSSFTAMSSSSISTTVTTKYTEELRGAPDMGYASNGKCSNNKLETGNREQKCQALKVVGFQSEKSESGDQDTMEDEITTEMKISEEPTVTVEDVPIESKGLFFLSDSFDEEGDLPYVPTTLPQEKSTGVPIIPVSERKRMALMLNTVPVQRPKVNRPANPASLNDYIAYSNTLPNKGGDGVKGDETSKESESQMKMKINLPREDSLTNSSGSTKSPRKKMSTTWTDFAHMGLRSPREIRRKMKEENGATDEISSYHRYVSSILQVYIIVMGFTSIYNGTNGEIVIQLNVCK